MLIAGKVVIRVALVPTGSRLQLYTLESSLDQPLNKDQSPIAQSHCVLLEVEKVIQASSYPPTTEG